MNKTQHSIEFLISLQRWWDDLDVFCVLWHIAFLLIFIHLFRRRQQEHNMNAYGMQSILSEWYRTMYVQIMMSKGKKVDDSNNSWKNWCKTIGYILIYIYWWFVLENGIGRVRWLNSLYYIDRFVWREKQRAKNEKQK